jgi:hypothetical protein
MLVIDPPLDHDLLSHHRPRSVLGANSVLTGGPVLPAGTEQVFNT